MQTVSRRVVGLSIVFLAASAGCRRPAAVPTAVPDASYASLDGLAAEAVAARERQKACSARLHLPLEIENRLGMRFRLIPPGEFDMGSPQDEPGRYENEGPVHRVRIRKAFYLGKTEVTQRQWESVMGENPSRFRSAGPDAPVESVSWTKAQEFVRKLCAQENVPEGTYRLPTEAEWEYACRAGTETALYTGPIAIEGERNAPALDPIAWYGGNSGVDYPNAYGVADWTEMQDPAEYAGTHPVGRKQPNAWGLYDMIGNVWEWCGDRLAYYPDELVEDPVGESEGPLRVIRGGSWFSPARRCRSAMRGSGAPDARGLGMGLRLLRVPPGYEPETGEEE